MPNIWLGTSLESEKYLRRITVAARVTDAPVVFVSAEPLLEPVTFGEYLDLVDWIIVGAERGVTTGATMRTRPRTSWSSASAAA